MRKWNEAIDLVRKTVHGRRCRSFSKAVFYLSLFVALSCVLFASTDNAFAGDTKLGRFATDQHNVHGDLSVSNSITASKINKVIIVDGDTYPQTSAGINAAISALGSAGGEVFLPEGTYAISDALSVSSYTTIRGAGASTILSLATGANTYVIGDADPASTERNITIRDLKIEGNDAGNTGADCYGVYLRDVTESAVINVWVDDTEDNGIQASNCNSSVIERCSVNNATYGILVYYSNGTRVVNSTARNNEAAGIGVHSSSNCIVAGNVAATNATHGIYVSATSQFAYSNIISANIAEYNTEDGINVYRRSYYTQVISNQVRYNQNGIHIEGGGTSYAVRRSLVSNNYCLQNAQNGIRAVESDYASILGNKLTDNGDSGNYSSIYVGSDSNETLISGNAIQDSAGTGYAIHIDGTTCDNTTLTNNIFSGTGASSIQNSGTLTRFTQPEHITVGDPTN
ncbi:MAG: hypothetical protein GY706_12640, partial [Bacteroides sp.]|nr:hypothetical protein [Bacteroides sp.]